MARRAVSHDSSDSLKENNGLPSSAHNNNTSKTGSAKGKRAAMRDHHDADDVEDKDAAMEEEDEDAQGDDDDDEGQEGAEDGDDDAGQSPKGRKRARANTQGDAHPTSGSSKPEKRGQTLPRDEDGFVPGSIVRIQLRNFLTYDWVEFRPGPYLNMIFGPNGTGKSSIACAICLGLNFPPAVLGRAQDLKSFVKNDKEEGHIEIELKGAKGKSNLVIRRNLSANSKTAPFMLNGRSASGKDINQRMAELNVQVSNLWYVLLPDIFVSCHFVDIYIEPFPTWIPTLNAGHSSKPTVQTASYNTAPLARLGHSTHPVRAELDAPKRADVRHCHGHAR